ncbi:restriction endonuclease subunit S [Xanthomonas campestris]|uniref:restriction endonuclease subunit S n=1 Tax=Xanthomonas campestris TaxID=339 RepID=UPI002368F0CB|nr:restriction endonuclease subunit S [Xanthomonas campestris]MEA9559975.1 restriction endonuclease subunit S [Xanthomonas campestris]MEA9722678.1 restriction endonuclease subunit S [Xanthomonas campestris]MEA9807313.1 restriction endonuclease subunit S [Xanthomonas campestris pv. raphani]MEB1884247.1 restriction endonuclease subunit S [Xanthomonas campestris pv. campestris]
MMLPEGWSRSTLGEIAKIASGGTPDRSKPEYWGGDVAWVTTGEIQFNTIVDTTEKITVAGLQNSSTKLFPPGTLLMAMYGQGKTRGQLAKLGIEATTNQNSAAILLNDGHEPDFYFHYLSSQYENIRDFGQAGGISHLNAGLLKQIPIPVAPVTEQRRIAHILSTWDQAIATTERLLANSRHQKMLLSQQVLTGKARLASFTASGHKRTTPYGSVPVEWDYPRIGDVAAEISEKLGESEPHPVLSCTKHHGLVDSLKYFKKQVFSVNTSTYKVAPRGCFVYATNHIDEGSIGYQNLYEAGLISPMYTVFKTSNRVVDAYLLALLKTEHYRQIFASAINASVDRRGSLRWKDFQRIHIPLPPVEEQQAIATMLSQAGREVELIKNQLDLLREEKSALMSQLLTGKRRVRLPADEAETA